MLPVTVDVTSGSEANRTEFSVMRHRDMAPILVRSVLVSAMESAGKTHWRRCAQLAGCHRTARRTKRKYEQFYSGPSAALVASIEAVQPMVAIARSPFTGIEVDSIHFTANVRETIGQARITGLPSTHSCADSATKQA